MTRTVLLGDEIELAYGKGLPQRSRVPGNFPVFGSNGRVDTHHEALLEGPGIIVGRKGSVGEVIWSDKDFWPIDTTYYVKLKNPDDSLRYWYYQLKTLGLNKLNTHSAIPGLNRDVAYAKTVIKRTPDEQKKIANILGTIDEKIELSRKINETLEQLGQALFRHYFIDNPEAEKWEDGTVSDLVTIYSGYAFKRTDFDPDGKYGLVTIKNVQDGNFLVECSDYLAEAPAKVPDYIHLKTGDVLLSLTGNVGRVCIAYGENLLLNQRVAKLAGTNNHQSFAYFMFRQNEFKDRLISMSRGTAQLNLSPVETKHIKIKLPPNDALDSFYENAEPLFKMIADNYQQVQTLSTLRDTLLPRLISGKIKI